MGLLAGQEARAFFFSLFLFNKKRGCAVEVSVRDNNVEQAIRVLKKKMQRGGVFREMKLRRHFEKPSERRKREREEAGRRIRRLRRKRVVRPNTSSSSATPPASPPPSL